MQSFFYGRLNGVKVGRAKSDWNDWKRNETRLPTGIMTRYFAVESLSERPILSGQ